MPQAHINFVYKLDGDIREVDIFSLAPTLLSLGELIQKSNKELNPDGADIGINVKPFREGSFSVDLAVFPQTHLQALLDVLSKASVDQVKSVLEVLGLVGGGPMGLIQLIKWLRGKPKKVEEVAPGEYKYTTGDDRSIAVAGNVHTLASDNSVTQNIYNVFVVPLEKQPFVSDIKTYIEGEKSEPISFGREDVQSLKEFASPLTAVPEEKTNEIIHESVYLNPKRGSFDGDPREWSFYRGDGEILTATIKDKRFLQDCIDGVYRLNASDLLTVVLLEKQTVVGTKVKKPVHEILSVTSYIKGEPPKPQL
jgi:hypothetical protein